VADSSGWGLFVGEAEAGEGSSALTHPHQGAARPRLLAAGVAVARHWKCFGGSLHAEVARGGCGDREVELVGARMAGARRAAVAMEMELCSAMVCKTKRRKRDRAEMERMRDL
jgi:hypothetical protein